VVVPIPQALEVPDENDKTDEVSAPKSPESATKTQIQRRINSDSKNFKQSQCILTDASTGTKSACYWHVTANRANRAKDRRKH